LNEILLDTRGHRCPVPTLKLRRACETAPPGSTLRVLADDPLARIDIPHFIAQAGLELIGIESEGRMTTVTLRKPL